VAVQSGNLAAAQAVNDRIYPTVRAFYRDPLLDMHNRMKEALVLLGRLDAAFVRPPLMKLHDEEVAAIREWLVEAELLR
jgi:4-hydroxy-tetrahydrodipicolinate synthase